MSINFSILRENVIFAFSVKRIKFYPINKWMFGTQQLKLCCVVCRMRKLKSSWWWHCSSVQLWMEHCFQLRPLIYSKSTWCVLWHTSAIDISHQAEFWWYHHQALTEMCNRNQMQRFTSPLSGLSLLLLKVILANPITQISKMEMVVILIPDGNFESFKAEILGLAKGWGYKFTRIWNSGARFVVDGANEFSMSTQKTYLIFSQNLEYITA